MLWIQIIILTKQIINIMRINVVIIYFVIGTLSIVANTSKQLYSVDKKIPSYLFDVNKTEKINRTQVLSRQEILQDLLFLNSNTSIMIANSLKDVNGGIMIHIKKSIKELKLMEQDVQFIIINMVRWFL